MKTVFILIVIVLVGLGYLAKYGRFADEAIEAVPVTASVARSVVSSAAPIANQLQQNETTIPKSVNTVTSVSSDQIEIAKRAIEYGSASYYATPEFEKLLRKASYITQTTSENGDCAVEHYYFGHGQDSASIGNWQITPLKNGVIRIAYNTTCNYNFDPSSPLGELCGAHLAEFTMKGNFIDDVRFGYSDNPKKFPTKTTNSLREDAQKVVNLGKCDW